MPAATSSTPAACGVTIQSVDLCANKIVSKLTGPPTNNDFFALAVYNSADPQTYVQIFSVATRTPGTYTDPFNISGVPVGVQYNTVEAVYVCGGFNNVATFAYLFKKLGTYRHSQYNTPDENHGTCQQGGLTAVCITDNNCNYSTGSLYETFRAKVDLNGSGKSINYGIIKPEQFCQNPPAQCQGKKIYRGNQQVTPACTGLSVSNTTVARKPNHPDLVCASKVCIVGAGPNGTNLKKTVTDLCPGCVTAQLDNYTTDGRCSGIVDLGNFMTVKIP